MSQDKKILVIKAVVGIVVIVTVVQCSLKQINSSPSRGDIDVFLNASRLAVAGENFYEISNRGGPDYYVYPPLLAILLVPLAYLPIEFVIVFWAFLNVGIVYMTLRLLYEAMSGEKFADLDARSRFVLTLLPCLLASRSLISHLSWGQTSLLSYFLAVLGLWLMTKRCASGGIVVGLSMVTKILTLPLGIWLVVKRDIKATLWTAAGVLIGLVLPAAVLGWDRNLSLLREWFFDVILTNEGRSAHWPLDINFSLTAQITRYFSVPGKDENASLVAICVMGAATVALGVYAWISRRSDRTISFWGGVALAFALIPVFSPVAEKHHFTALIPAYFLIIYLWYCRGLRDKISIGSVLASSVLTTFTSEGFVGTTAAHFLQANGCFMLSALCLAAAIFRLPFVNIRQTEPTAA